MTTTKTTKKKNEPTTGFRNGNLFCFNCGTSFNMQLPQPVSFVANLMKLFDKEHKNCTKTWQPPVVDQSLSENEKALWWANKKNGEQGESSKKIWSVMTGSPLVPINEAPHPHDPDDFRRCYLLLQTVPEWKEKLHLMKNVSPVWEKLVENWDLFTELLEEQMRGKQNHLYELMKEIGC